MIGILLGAGASYEAGLPLAAGLTDAIVKHIPYGWGKVLDFVRLTMQASAASRSGGNYDYQPVAGIDSEALFNTTYELVNRDRSELGPFVHSWHPLLVDITAEESRKRLEGQLGKILKIDQFAGPAAREIAESIVDISKGAPLNDAILKYMKSTVIQSLAPTKPLDYLYPLAVYAGRKSEPLVVATLNYDICIEGACEQTGTSYSDGFGPEPEPFNLHFDDSSSLHLYKLHGSASWERTPDGSIKHGSHSTAILFGGRNKLTADFPYLDIFWQWRESLSRMTHIWAIGYSFRDDHINSVLDRWLVGAQDRQLIVVDPYFEEDSYHPLAKFLREQSNLSMRHRTPDIVDPVTGQSQYVPGPPAHPRVVVLKEGTGDALRRFARAGSGSPDAVDTE